MRQILEGERESEAVDYDRWVVSSRRVSYQRWVLLRFTFSIEILNIDHVRNPKIVHGLNIAHQVIVRVGLSRVLL